VEADPGGIGQARDPLGSEDGVQLAEELGQAPGAHHGHAVGDQLAQGTLAPWTATSPTISTPGVART
jgi:hypothetical protein